MTRKLGKPIALGRTAEIYAWDDRRVLKLFNDWFDLESIRFEQEMSRAVHDSGLPVPAVGDIVQVNGRNGLIYERVDGVSMWEVLGKQPWLLLRFARQTADLHARMHARPIQPDLPSQHQRLERKIRGADPLPAPLKQAALEALASLPQGDCLCHGDFHPQNILVTERGPVIIDWIDASLGSPLSDVARTSVIILGAAASRQVPDRFQKAFARLFHTRYLHHYFRLRPGGEEEYHRWLPVVAAARLSEGIAELEDWLVEQVHKGLEGNY
jgi:uncharacterized protein (TIGR02172 family)